MISLESIASNKIALGSAGFSGDGGGYGFGDVSDTEIEKIFEYSLENNIALIDTAPIYGFGEAEKKIGELIGAQRERFFIISKGGVSWHSSKRVNMTNCPKELEKMLLASLKRLKTDYLDGHMIHWPDPNVDIRFSYEFLAKMKEKQIIRHIGLSNTNQNEIQLAEQVAPVEMIQGEFNLFNDQSFNEINASLNTAWGTLDKGIISGRVKEGRSYSKSDCRGWAPWWKKSNKDKKIKLMKKVFQILAENELSFWDLVFHHQNKHSNNLTHLYGVKTCDDLKQIVTQQKSSKEISEEVINRIITEFKNEGFSNYPNL